MALFRHALLGPRLVMTLATIVVVNVLWIEQRVANCSLPSQDISDVPSSIPSSSTSSSCLHDKYFDSSEWKKAVHASIEFHDKGGNMKSVQAFQDKYVDETAQALGLTFLDNNKEEQNQPSEHLRQYYEKNYDPRGGYGKPLPGTWKEQDQADKRLLMGKRWINAVFEPTDGRLRWDAGLGPIGPNCPNLMRLGDEKGDGYKFYCQPADQSSTSQSNNNNNNGNGNESKGCQVLSVGGNDNWKFESAVVDQLGCTTHTFDCTLPGGVPKKKPEDDRIHFYNYCIDGTTRTDPHGRQYLSYQDMLQKAGITSAPSYFKIDVEGFEYDIFQSMVAHSPALLPTQIQVEMHWATRMTGVEWMLRTKSSAEIALFSSMMHRAGYLPILLDFNKYCTTCMEVLYFRSSTNAEGNQCYADDNDGNNSGALKAPSLRLGGGSNSAEVA
jgi:Methyltransferase domain